MTVRDVSAESRLETAHVPEERLPALDGVRAISILLVLAAHTLPLGPKFLTMNAAAGTMGMSLFFCLSGFLITRFLLTGQPLQTFALRRIMRIVPAVTVYILVLFFFFDLPEAALMGNLTFISNYYHEALQGGPVSHLWSLCVEMHFYIVVALTVAVFGRRALYAIPMAALAITLLRIDAGSYVNIKTHLRADEILAGGCLALLHAERMRLQSLFRFAGRSASLMVPLMGVLWFASSHEVGGPLNFARPYFAASLVFFAVFGGIQFIVRFLSAQPFGYIARISYALYIWHPLMIFGVMNQGSTWERYLLKRPLSFMMTWLVAHLSTHWLEQPISRFIRSLDFGPRVRPATDAASFRRRPSYGRFDRP